MIAVKMDAPFLKPNRVGREGTIVTVCHDQVKLLSYEAKTEDGATEQARVIMAMFNLEGCDLSGRVSQEREE